MIRVQGFADLPAFETSGLGRVVRLQGPSPQTTALGDAVELLFAALSHESLKRLVARWELCGPGEEPEIIGEVFPEQVSWTDPWAARSIVGPEPGRAIRVEARFALDPPLFGELRQKAAREPRLVAALAGGAELQIEVGALFTTTYDAMALNVHKVALGDETFGEQDRSRWVDRLLLGLAGRFYRHDPQAPLAERCLEALTSRDRYDAYQAWERALLPDGPLLRAARGAGGRPQVLADERPLGRWGRVVQEQAALAGAVHLSGADILWAETGEEALEQGVTGDASPLEQVWQVLPEGEVVVRPIESSPPLTTPLPTTLRETGA